MLPPPTTRRTATLARHRPRARPHEMHSAQNDGDAYRYLREACSREAASWPVRASLSSPCICGNTCQAASSRQHLRRLRPHAASARGIGHVRVQRLFALSFHFWLLLFTHREWVLEKQQPVSFFSKGLHQRDARDSWRASPFVPNTSTRTWPAQRPSLACRKIKDLRWCCCQTQKTVLRCSRSLQ